MLSQLPEPILFLLMLALGILIAGTIASAIVSIARRKIQWFASSWQGWLCFVLTILVASWVT